MDRPIMIRIVIIDNHESDLNRIYKLLASQRDFKITGLGRDGYDCLKMVAKLSPDVIIMDISLEYINGAKFVSLLKRRSPATSIILFTASENEEYIREAVCSGISGYLLKDADMNKLAATVRRVFKGGKYITPKITNKILQMFSSLIRHKTVAAFSPPEDTVRPLPSDISRTELKIIAFLAQGRSNKEIAENLRLKTGTVRNYVSSAMRKAGLHNRTEVALFAIQNGLAGQPFPEDTTETG